jgi:peroxiredoxin
MPQVGTPAPSFTLYDADKKERTLSEFLVKGKRTILAFYPGAFTSVCTAELCTFRDTWSDLEKMNAIVVGISVDPPFAQKAFAEKYGFKFPLLCDFDRKVTQEYGLLWHDLGGVKGYDVSNRAIFTLDDTGKVLYSWVADHTSVPPDFDGIRNSLA